ncbi:MAG: hypothetical protein ACUZ8N_17095 [Candidatus Scalindua sp.]
MPHFQIQSQNITGFIDNQPKPGDKMVRICQKKTFISSEEPMFQILITEISKVFLHKIQYPIDRIYKFLIVLHQDCTADLFINDFKETMNVQVNRSVKKGEPIYEKDIKDIFELQFPEIKLESNDAVIYCNKIGWKFGLYFNLTRKIDFGELYKELGRLTEKLSVERYISSTNYELINKLKEKRDIDAFVVTEGKTDWKHLGNAKGRLKNNLNIEFDEYQDDRGDKDILKMCENFLRIYQPFKMIFVFDQDNPVIIKILDEKTMNDAKYQVWDNNVFSFYIPKPSHREEYKNISIEFYYTDDEIHTIDPNTGKQLIFSNEVEKRVTESVTTKKNEIKFVKLNKPKDEEELDKKIYCKDVEKIVDESGGFVAHSKDVFANNILTEKEGFNNFNFTEFNRIFDIIGDIIKLKN